MSTNHENISNEKGFPSGHMTAFYTLLVILMKIKKEQGLEAMLEYMTTFIAVIDSHNPKLSQAVSQTMKHTSTEVIYEQLGQSPNKDI